MNGSLSSTPLQLYYYCADVSIGYARLPYIEREDSGPAFVTVEVRGSLQRQITVRLTSEPSGDPNGAIGTGLQHNYVKQQTWAFLFTIIFYKKHDRCRFPHPCQEYITLFVSRDKAMYSGSSEQRTLWDQPQCPLQKCIITQWNIYFWDIIKCPL